MKPFGVFLVTMAILWAATPAGAQVKRNGNSAAAKARVAGAHAHTSPAPAKSVTGIWRGYFITETGEQYKLEFQVDQNAKAARGVSYSYLDTRFYGKSTMSGTFFAGDDKFRIEELRTVELRNLPGNGTCLMNYNLTFSQSGREQFLEGTYMGRHEDRDNPKRNGTWGDCGGGRVFLRKVETTDFPIEPFLANKKPAPRPDTVARARVTPKPATPKPAPPVARRNNPPAKPQPARTAPRQQPANTGVARTNTVQQSPVDSKPAEPVRKPEPKVVIPPVTRNRENTTARILTVHNPEVLVRLYDNGEVDDDTISVYVDSKLVLANKRLSSAPIELRVKLDEDHPEHTVVMVAENMGRIPPNTSLMIVWDGEQRYEVQMTSTEQKNAMVRFRYQKPGSGGTP